MNDPTQADLFAHDPAPDDFDQRHDCKGDPKCCGAVPRDATANAGDVQPATRPPSVARRVSREARKLNAPRAPSQRTRILNVLAAAFPQGLTAHALADKLKLPLHTTTARLCELVADGLVGETGETRPTPFGGRARVLRRVPGVKE